MLSTLFKHSFESHALDSNHCCYDTEGNHCCVSPQDDGQLRFSVADLQAQLEPLLSRLFGAFRQPESGENQYVMKCIARLIAFVGPQVRICSEDTNLWAASRLASQHLARFQLSRALDVARIF